MVFGLLVDFMARYCCFGVFLILRMRVEEDVFGYVVRSVPTLWDVYPGNLIICLDFVTRSFLDAARNLFRRFFFGFFFFVSLFAVDPSTSIDHVLFRASSGSLDVPCGRVENDSLRSYLQGLDSVSLGVMALFSCTCVPRLSCCRVCRALSLTFRSCFPCSWRITLGSLWNWGVFCIARTDKSICLMEDWNCCVVVWRLCQDSKLQIIAQASNWSLLVMEAQVCRLI